ncbi:MAG: hypothetical protein V4520_18430 [Bacteroidota bacterium]
MAKVSAKNVRNALKRIGIEEYLMQSESVFTNAINNFRISLDDIQQVLTDNPAFNNYRLLKAILDKVIAINKENNLALFVCYQLLAKYAKEDGEHVFDQLNELAMRHHLDWKLTGDYPYAMIITKCNCCKCRELDEFADKTEIVKRLFMQALTVCEGMANSTVVTLSDAGYLRRLKYL